MIPGLHSHNHLLFEQFLEHHLAIDHLPRALMRIYISEGGEGGRVGGKEEGREGGREGEREGGWEGIGEQMRWFTQERYPSPSPPLSPPMQTVRTWEEPMSSSTSSVCATTSPPSWWSSGSTPHTAAASSRRAGQSPAPCGASDDCSSPPSSPFSPLLSPPTLYSLFSSPSLAPLSHSLPFPPLPSPPLSSSLFYTLFVFSPAGVVVRMQTSFDLSTC